MLQLLEESDGKWKTDVKKPEKTVFHTGRKEEETLPVDLSEEFKSDEVLRTKIFLIA